MTALFWERWLPYVLAAILVVAWWFLGSPFPADATNLLLATGTTSAVLVGFIATVMAIILSITGSPVFRALRRSGYHEELFRYLFEAIVAGMSFLVVAMMGFFAGKPTELALHYQVVWVVVGSITLFVFLRVFHLVFKLLKQA